MVKVKIKPSKYIFENAKIIYFQKNGKHLLSYQTPPNEYVLQAILDFIDDNHEEIELHEPEIPSIQQEVDLNENDSQPEFSKYKR